MLNSKFTDDKYIPMDDLKKLKIENLQEIKKYRDLFKEVIFANNQILGTLVETPTLIKKRFQLNIELLKTNTSLISIGDIVLEIAKNIVQRKKDGLIKIPPIEIEKLLKLYRLNNNDLTIIVVFILKNSRYLIFEDNFQKISILYPNLQKKDVHFLINYHLANNHYSIEDFRILNQTSYETARKGLARLTQCFLYNKEKIGKKFVYVPSHKLLKLIKGGRVIWN